jgi:UrcA family protein
MKSSTRILALCALLGLPLAFTVPAVAADGEFTEVVKYNDLNLATADGALALYARLKAASRRVCRDIVLGSGAPAMLERSNCVTRLIDTAVRDVNRPVLTALHQGRVRPASLTASR